MIFNTCEVVSISLATFLLLICLVYKKTKNHESDKSKVNHESDKSKVKQEDDEPQKKHETRSYIEGFQRRMLITSGVRFLSEERYKRKHLHSVFAVNILSLCVICFELMSILVEEKTRTMNILFPIGTIVAPVFIIILASHENAKMYLVIAERMRRSAQAISKLAHDFEYKRHINGLESDIFNIHEEYEEVIKDSLTNHDDVDYKYYIQRHPKLFPEVNISYCDKIYVYMRYNLDGWLVVITIVPLFIVLWSVILLIKTA